MLNPTQALYTQPPNRRAQYNFAGILRKKLHETPSRTTCTHRVAGEPPVSRPVESPLKLHQAMEPILGELGVLGFRKIPPILGGSWVVINGVVISSATILISHIRGLTTPLITTHEPPSRAFVKDRYSSPEKDFSTPSSPYKNPINPT